MTKNAEIACCQAMWNIRAGHFEMAIACLQDALHGVTNPRVWSKLMLAIRECNRALRAGQ